MRNKLLPILLLSLFDLCFGQTVGTAIIRRDSLHLDKKHVLSDTALVKDTLSFRKDSLSVKDTAKVLAQIIIPKSQFPLESARGLSSVIDKEQILFNDYRFTGELLERFPFTFIRDLQTLGQPSEALVYGAGWNEISFLEDGLLLNSRLTNSFDLNHLQSESVDSIEILPSPRGFLYGPFNNQTSVNFVSKETFSLKERGAPYSRIRYYQAQNDEAIVDFIYNSHWFRRISTTFELTNKTYNDPQNPQLNNSDYSLWNVTFKLKYFLSNSFNIIGSYNFIKSKVGLYGGISQHYYNDTVATGVQRDLKSANVYFTDRGDTNTFHNVVLQLLGNPFTSNKIDVKAYYRFNLNAFRQNGNQDRIFDNNRSRVYGASLRDIFDYSHFRFDLTGYYENQELRTDMLSINRKIRSYSISASAALKLIDSSFVPSAFGKLLNYDGKTYPGLGADAVYNYSSKLQLYAGISQSKQPFNPVEEQYLSVKQPGFQLQDRKITSLEAGLKLDIKGLKNSLSVFHRNIMNDVLFLTSGFENNKYPTINHAIYNNTDYWGIGAGLNFNWGPAYLETYGAYYYSKNDPGRYRLPEFTLRGGIFYRDTLFDANLHLKTGFYVQYSGVENSYFYDFEKQIRAVNTNGTGEIYSPSTVGPSFRLDFRLVGQIQQKAILYFTVENLLDNRSYIIPYYASPGRDIRIGVSWEFLN